MTFKVWEICIVRVSHAGRKSPLPLRIPEVTLPNGTLFIWWFFLRDFFPLQRFKQSETFGTECDDGNFIYLNFLCRREVFLCVVNGVLDEVQMIRLSLFTLFADFLRP